MSNNTPSPKAALSVMTDPSSTTTTGQTPPLAEEKGKHDEDEDSLFDGLLDSEEYGEPDYTLEGCMGEIFLSEDDDGGCIAKDDDKEEDGSDSTEQEVKACSVPQQEEQQTRSTTPDVKVDTAQTLPFQSCKASTKPPPPPSPRNVAAAMAAAELAKVDTRRYKREMIRWRQQNHQKHPSLTPLYDYLRHKDPNFATLASFDVTKLFLQEKDQVDEDAKPCADENKTDNVPQAKRRRISRDNEEGDDSRPLDAETPLQNSAFWSRQLFQASRNRM